MRNELAIFSSFFFDSASASAFFLVGSALAFDAGFSLFAGAFFFGFSSSSSPSSSESG